jgi:L-asparaginase II
LRGKSLSRAPAVTAPCDEPSPILVEIIRGEMVESFHRGAVAVVDAAGKVARSLGDVDRLVYPRSALKPIQALPLIETGAADGVGLGPEELALACASHRGEPPHIDKVAAWLAKIGLGEADLECGIHPPRHEASYAALLRAGGTPSQLHNNCSGKHAGFLTTAVWRREPTRGYIESDHPVQRRVAETVGEMAGLDLSRAPRGRDGCGIPVIALPLCALARAMARLADPSGLSEPRRAAAQRLLDAMAAAPLLVDGTGGMTATLMSVAGAALRLKPGAEGVFAAALPSLGLGVALKIDDGGARAAELAMATVLDRLGCLTSEARSYVEPLLAPPLKTVAGREAGRLQPTALLQSL